MLHLQLVASLGLLLVGGELLVRGAVAIARRLGRSELMIGLTLVGFGTSTPELILGILGATTLVAPLAVPASIARFDAWVMLAGAIIGGGFAMSGWRINRLEGGLLLLAYVGYLLLVVG